MSNIRGLGCRLASFAIAASLVVLSGVTVASHPAAATTAAAGSYSASETVTRADINADGTQDPVDTRHVAINVSQTTDLRGRQEINVSWTGAHPTGGIVPNINSGDADQEEYPFVLLECRGTDSSSVPAADQLTPRTCWTQTAQERYQDDSGTAFPPYRDDRYASSGDRAAFANEPNPLPTGCFGGYLASHWVPFDAENGTVYLGGSQGCAGMAPEASNVGGAGLPSNATYGITATDGSGNAQFDVWTEDDNASLGCSDTVPCSLVAIPIMGISCDTYDTAGFAGDQPPTDEVATDDATCRATGAYAPGTQHQSGILSDQAVTGSLWWSASNWRQRITVPLSFAPPSNVCSVIGTGSSLNIYGSVLMAEATAQWEPAFCTNPKLFGFTHVQTSDPAARNLVANSTIEAALSSEAPPGGYGKPVVQAPVAVTGFAISFVIDDDQGNPVSTLRLDPRLLAKLLTESYPADPEVRDNYPALSKNPLNITQDPEFIALNPDIPQVTNEAAAELVNISSAADLTYALTSYINADPEARAWLNGQPDPWGMTVNPNYKSIALPVTSWPLLDNFNLPASYISSDVNPCYTHSPSPWLSLIADPTALLANIAQDVQFATSNVETVCNGTLDDISSLKMLTQGQQQVGHRFLIGVTSLGEASRYDLAPASLQTTANVPYPSAKFTDDEGRSFVAPTDGSLDLATKLLHPDPVNNIWQFRYSDFSASSSADAAYPGTMVVYADVPTKGLPLADAGKLATLLRFAAAAGQSPGFGNGELPPGYLPMTAANGLGALVAYTNEAADAVAAQRGDVPQVAPQAGPSSPLPGLVSGVGGVKVKAPKASGTGVHTQQPTSPDGPGSAAAQASELKLASVHSGFSAIALPILALLTAIGAIAGAVQRYPSLRRVPSMHVPAGLIYWLDRHLSGRPWPWQRWTRRR